MRRTGVLAAVAGSSLAAAAWAGSPDQDRAYAAELKADSLNKSSALDSTAAEGDTKVVLGGFTQFRYTMNFRDQPDVPGLPHQSGFTNGFEAERTRLQATGNVMSKDFTFKVEGQFDSSGDFQLLDAFAGWSYGNGMTAIFGQFQNPLWREWALSPHGELGADYSVATGVFNPGYSQGVAWNYKVDAWNVLVAIDDGFRAGNTPYFGSNEADIGLTGRFEFKGGGDWKQFDDFSGWRGEDTAWLVGFGGHWQHNGDTSANVVVAQTQIVECALDAQFEGNGWNAYGGIIWQHVDPDTGGGSSTDDFGVVLQGGYFFTENVEGFVGWNGIFVDDSYGPGLDNSFNTAMLGVNFYPFAKSSAIKFTTDLQWFFDPTTTNGQVAPYAASNNTVGLLPSTEDNQVAVRFQLQVTF